MAYRHLFPTVQNERAVQILAAARIRPFESTVLCSAFVLAWIPYQDERLHTGKRESGSKTATLVFADNCPQPFLYRAQLDALYRRTTI